MIINENQKKILNKLLYNYELTKNIDDLSSLEASILIEGLYNKGQVKNTFKGRILSDESFERKQNLYNSLIKPKILFATEKQKNFISTLLKNSKYERNEKEILKSDVNLVIDFLKSGKNSEIALQYLNEKKETRIRKKEIVLKETVVNFPKNWIFKDTDISGIVKYSLE